MVGRSLLAVPIAVPVVMVVVAPLTPTTVAAPIVPLAAPFAALAPIPIVVTIAAAPAIAPTAASIGRRQPG